MCDMAHHIVRSKIFKWTRGVVSALVVAVGGFLSNPTSAHAADLSTSSSDVCAFTLNGPIVTGDRDRLAALIAVSRLDSLDERTTTLSLNEYGKQLSGATVHTLSSIEANTDGHLREVR